MFVIRKTKWFHGGRTTFDLSPRAEKMYAYCFGLYVRWFCRFFALIKEKNKNDVEIGAHSDCITRWFYGRNAVFDLSSMALEICIQVWHPRERALKK